MWKLTFFFTQFNFTWTETYYAPGNISLAALQNICFQVGTARVGMNAPQCILTLIRAVNLSNPRVSFPFTFASGSWGGTFVQLPATDPDQDAAPQFAAIQVKFYGVNGHVCRRYISGFPEAIMGTKFSGRNLEPLGLWINALTQFVAALNANSFSFRYQSNPYTPLLSGAPTLGVQTPPEIGLSFGAQIMTVNPAPKPYQILLRGFRKVNYRQFGLAGIYTVDPTSPGITASAAPYLYYLRNTSNVAPANIAQTGTGVQLTYAFDVFGTSGAVGGGGFNVLSANHRKRGVSALSLRGRSRSKP